MFTHSLYYLAAIVAQTISALFPTLVSYSFLFSSDILKKFNPSLKGFSKGQLAVQKGFNMAVSEAKTSYVHILLITPFE